MGSVSVRLGRLVIGVSSRTLPAAVPYREGVGAMMEA